LGDRPLRWWFPTRPRVEGRGDQDRSKTAQDRLKKPQDRPKFALGCSGTPILCENIVPSKTLCFPIEKHTHGLPDPRKTGQDRLKSTPSWFKAASRRPVSAQDSRRSHQDRSKFIPRPLQDRPRHPEDRPDLPKTIPRGLQGLPRRPHDHPRALQETPQDSPDALTILRETSKLSQEAITSFLDAFVCLMCG